MTKRGKATIFTNDVLMHIALVYVSAISQCSCRGIFGKNTASRPIAGRNAQR